jgi:hypothetical protein
VQFEPVAKPTKVIPFPKSSPAPASRFDGYPRFAKEFGRATWAYVRVTPEHVTTTNRE